MVVIRFCPIKTQFDSNKVILVGRNEANAAYNCTKLNKNKLHKFEPVKTLKVAKNNSDELTFE